MVTHRITLAGLLLLASGCARHQEETAAPVADTIPFRIDGMLDFVRGGETLLGIHIEIAATDSAQERGMMQRTHFPPNSGMLFPFPREEMRQFWMGNTPLALDLLFISADSQIVDFSTYAKPYSAAPIPSRVPAQYVLEVPAGFVDLQGIVEGDRVSWRRY